MTYTAPKYPRIKFEDDARRKLSKDDVAEMQSLRRSGWSYRRLGKQFGVSPQTAHYHTDPAWAEELNKKRYQKLKKQLADDPELAKQRNYEWNQRFLERARNEPEVADFKAKHTYKWKKEKYHTDEEFKKKTQEQARAKYRRDMETQPEKLRERWQRRNLKRRLAKATPERKEVK